MKIKGLEFVLENCEVLFLDLSHKPYYSFHFGKCHQSYMAQTGDFSTSESTEYFYFKSELKEFKDNLSNTNFAGPEGVQPSKEDCWTRFSKGRDVTSVVVKFEDDSEKQIYLPWKGEWTNKNQHIKIIKKNNSHEDLLEIHFDKHYHWEQFRHNMWLFFNIKIDNFFYKLSQIFKRKKYAKN